MQLTNGPSVAWQIGLVFGQTVWAQEQSTAFIGHADVAQPTVVSAEPTRTQTWPLEQTAFPHWMGFDAQLPALTCHFPMLQYASCCIPLLGHVASL
jgi:hypothetical protein